MQEKGNMLVWSDCGASEKGVGCRSRVGGAGLTWRGVAWCVWAQDPLREMAGMCVGQSEDVLSLQLHPLQHALDRGERLRFLHRAFVTVVNEVMRPFTTRRSRQRGDASIHHSSQSSTR